MRKRVKARPHDAHQHGRSHQRRGGECQGTVGVAEEEGFEPPNEFPR